MAKLYGAQRMVLQAVSDLPKDAAGYVTDAQIARRTQIASSEVRDWIETLEGEGLVEFGRTTEGLSVLLTPKGRLQLSSPSTTGGDASGGSRWNIRGSGTVQNEYQPAPWEKICVVTTALLVVLLVGFLVVRNKQFNDPNLVVLIRTVLSTAVAVLGASIPGFLYVDLSTRGVLIRAGGALSVFVLTFFFSPNVLPGPVIPPPVSPVNDEPQKPSRDGESNAPKISQPPNSPTLNTSILAGDVIDQKTGESLPGVIVTIQNWDTLDGQTPTRTTDHAGRFRFDNLRPSSGPIQQVRINARKPGYDLSSTYAPLGTTSHPINLRPITTSKDDP